ncbi:MAG: intradiol ring-cleavage dioxygenase [Sphingomonadaceae bacterium]
MRSDIRSSFIGSSTAVAAGVTMTFTITVVDANNSCAPLAGYAIYVWHCDATGLYSLYNLPNESYLRGVQVTDANGQVTFTTIVPGCYAGRYPHIHFEVFSSLANATNGRSAVLISQFAIPAAVCSAVYSADSGVYGQSANRFASTSIASDGVFGDDTSAQITVMTPSMSGSVANGYTASATVGIAT